MVTEQKPCYACGKRAAINEGLCFGCLLEYAKHQADFANITTSTYQPSTINQGHNHED